MLRKDVEDQRCSIKNANLERLLKVTCLTRTQLIVKDDQPCTCLFAQGGNLFHFARTDEELGERLVKALEEAPYNIETGSIGEKGQLAQRVGGTPGALQARNFSTYEECAGAWLYSYMEAFAILGTRLVNGNLLWFYPARVNGIVT